jgi:membrane protein DedA with SNARE-associated domain
MSLENLISLAAWPWLLRLGGLGLVGVGLADGSVVPLPGSTDALTIVLAAGSRKDWPYYAAMATLGSALGGYLTYRLGRKGGKEALERKISRERLQKIYRKFDRGAFQAVFVPALLPPPVPMVPFVLAAGVMNYPPKKFLTALVLGRALRFSIVAFLASIYGKSILGFLREYREPVLWAFVGLVVLGGLIGLFYFIKHRRSRDKQHRQHVGQDVAA